jgi:hypothetical protein
LPEARDRTTSATSAAQDCGDGRASWPARTHSKSPASPPRRLGRETALTLSKVLLLYTRAFADTVTLWKNTSIFPAYFASTPIITHTLPSDGATTSCFKVPLIFFDA